MATAKQRSKGVWGIQIKVGSTRESATFATKREAELWAARRKMELTQQSRGQAGETKTLQDAVERFVREVSPTHKGERWERIRLEALLKMLPASTPLARLTAAHFNTWKQERLQQVSPATVAREMNMLSSVLSYARKDWGWMHHAPLADVRYPPQPRHRERVISWRETRLLLRQLDYSPGKRPESITGMAGYALLLALRTGMRAGEICGMEWKHVHGQWVTLPDTKNGDARDVPLSRKALRLLATLRTVDRERVLLIRAATLDALFRKAKARAGLPDIRFHDSRHTAATRIGRTVGQPGKLSFPEFCKVFGWRDPKHALIYVNPTAAELAQKL